jgi:hypothetical protein
MLNARNGWQTTPISSAISEQMYFNASKFDLLLDFTIYNYTISKQQ